MYITVMFILHNLITIHVHVATMGYNGAEDSKNQKKVLPCTRVRGPIPAPHWPYSAVKQCQTINAPLELCFRIW